jgi:hypothetical protein
MKDAVERGSVVMIFIVSFIKTASDFQVLLGRMHIQTRRHTDRKVIS